MRGSSAPRQMEEQRLAALMESRRPSGTGRNPQDRQRRYQCTGRCCCRRTWAAQLHSGGHAGQVSCLLLCNGASEHGSGRTCCSCLAGRRNCLANIARRIDEMGWREGYNERRKTKGKRALRYRAEAPRSSLLAPRKRHRSVRPNSDRRFNTMLALMLQEKPDSRT